MIRLTVLSAVGLCLALVAHTLVFVFSTSIAHSAPITTKVSASGVCIGALAKNSGTSGAAQWDYRELNSIWVAEAVRRNYTPEYCQRVLASESSPEPAASKGASSSPLKLDPTIPLTTNPPVNAVVVSIQTLLSALGYLVGAADGAAGPVTITAITEFQKSIGDRPDGLPTEALKGKLQRALAERGPGSAPKQPDKPRDGSKGDTKLVSTGTGFFIAGDIIITNNHVIEGCKEIRVAKRGAEIGGARSIATNRGDDLAALRADKPSENYLKLRIGVPVKAAEPVLVFGYPLSVVLSSSGNTTLGNVTALAGLKDDSRYIQISASVQPGNSGGPVLDEAGRLVGVIEGIPLALKAAVWFRPVRLPIMSPDPQPSWPSAGRNSN